MASQKECSLQEERGKRPCNATHLPHGSLNPDPAGDCWAWSGSGPSEWGRSVRGEVHFCPQTFSQPSPPQQRGLPCVPQPPSLFPFSQFSLPSKNPKVHSRRQGCHRPRHHHSTFPSQGTTPLPTLTAQAATSLRAPECPPSSLSLSFQCAPLLPWHHDHF